MNSWLKGAIVVVVVQRYLTYFASMGTVKKSTRLITHILGLCARMFRIELEKPKTAAKRQDTLQKE